MLLVVKRGCAPLPYHKNMETLVLCTTRRQLQGRKMGQWWYNQGTCYTDRKSIVGYHVQSFSKSFYGMSDCLCWTEFVEVLIYYKAWVMEFTVQFSVLTLITQRKKAIVQAKWPTLYFYLDGFGNSQALFSWNTSLILKDRSACRF